ncbi:MAG: hypothetical protein WD032_10075 [Nitrospirales bacterium]
MDRLNHDLSKAEESNSFRCAGKCRTNTDATRTGLVGLVLGFCLISSPLGVLAGDEPQELPKPFHMTTPPLFQEWLFDQSTLANVPEGFSQEGDGQTGQGGWVVSKDTTAPSRPNLVEQQLTCGEGLCYQLLSVDDVTVEYVDLSVRMKMRLGTPSGKAGLAYGIQDAKNFYAVVVEPKSNEIVAYVVKDGQPAEIARETLILEPSEWHFLRIQRNTIVSKEFTEIFFDHHLLINVYDQSFKKGKIGLVAMGDGAFSFDNLRAMELLTNRPLSRPAAY